MNNPDFQLTKGLPREVKIIPHKIYEIPHPSISATFKRPTHIGAYNGQYGYYNSSHLSDFKGCGKKSKNFYKIPDSAFHLVFQNCKGHPGNPSGFIAGRPTFIEVAKTHQFNPSPFPPRIAFAT